MEQNIAQQDKSIDNQLPNNSGGGKNRKILAIVTIVLAVTLALVFAGYFGCKFYKNRQAVSPPPITDLENKPDIKREDTGVNLSKDNKTGTGEVITGDTQ